MSGRCHGKVRAPLELVEVCIEQAGLPMPGPVAARRGSGRPGVPRVSARCGRAGARASGGRPAWRRDRGVLGRCGRREGALASDRGPLQALDEPGGVAVHSPRSPTPRWRPRPGREGGTPRSRGSSAEGAPGRSRAPGPEIVIERASSGIAAVSDGNADTGAYPEPPALIGSAARKATDSSRICARYIRFMNQVYTPTHPCVNNAVRSADARRRSPPRARARTRG